MGMNCHGQLGLSAATHPYVPFPMTIKAPRGVSRISKIACGGYHSFFITSSAELYACGSHSYGQLGIGRLMEETRRSTSWRRVPTPQNEKVKCVAGGEHHSILLTQSGCVFACGRNSDGQCGLPEGTEYALTFKELIVPESIQHISVGLGAAHSCTLSKLLTEKRRSRFNCRFDWSIWASVYLWLWAKWTIGAFAREPQYKRLYHLAANPGITERAQNTHYCGRRSTYCRLTDDKRQLSSMCTVQVVFFILRRVNLSRRRRSSFALQLQICSVLFFFVIMYGCKHICRTCL